MSKQTIPFDVERKTVGQLCLETAERTAKQYAALVDSDFLAKPCPFCGKHPEIRVGNVGTTVECCWPECWVQPQVTTKPGLLVGAIEAWNQRR